MNTTLAAHRNATGSVKKYLIDMGCSVVDMPSGARILAVDGVGNNIIIMALATDSAQTEKRHFETHFTETPQAGQSPLRFLGSVTVYKESSRVYVFENLMTPAKAGALNEKLQKASS